MVHTKILKKTRKKEPAVTETTSYTRAVSDEKKNCTSDFFRVGTNGAAVRTDAMALETTIAAGVAQWLALAAVPARVRVARGRPVGRLGRGPSGQILDLGYDVGVGAGVVRPVAGQFGEQQVSRRLRDDHVLRLRELRSLRGRRETFVWVHKTRLFSGSISARWRVA